MKVLQINCVYPGGSTGQLTQAIHRHLLALGIESRVIYGRGPKVTERGVEKLCSEWYAKGNALRARLTGDTYGGCALATEKLLRLLAREKPDVVHLQCINGDFVNLPRLLEWLKQNRVKTVLTLHAEFPYTGGCAHGLDCEKWHTGCGHCLRFRQETGSLFWDGTAAAFRSLQAAYRGFEKDLVIVSVSPWLRRRAEQSPMLREMRHETIPNGVDTHCFYNRQQNKRGKIVLFHATPLFSEDPAHLKGGRYVLELAKRLQELPLEIRIAGKTRLSGSAPGNVILLGELEREEMANQYAEAKLTLLTSRGETFSMVTAESLCCGTPVVGFRCGAPEEIALPAFSQFLPYGDLDGLEGAVRSWLQISVDRGACAAQAAERYALDAMLERYTALYRRLAYENSD